MRMDVESRGLPRGWLVNENGDATKLVGSGFRCVDPYGDPDRPYCDACSKLNKTIQRYRPLL